MTTQATYPIAIDPTLGLSPAELAAAWNTNPTTAAHGRISVNPLPTKGFDLAGMGLEFVGGLAVGLFTNYLYDLIKGAFAERPQPPTFTVQPIDQPDGAKVLVIIKS